jgi:hypothetical protein
VRAAELVLLAQRLDVQLVDLVALDEADHHSVVLDELHPQILSATSA